MDAVILSGPALGVCAGVGTLLCGTIAFLQKQAMAQLIARAERAERQVDTLLPAITQLTSAVQHLGEKM